MSAAAISGRETGDPLHPRTAAPVGAAGALRACFLRGGRTYANTPDGKRAVWLFSAGPQKGGPALRGLGGALRFAPRSAARVLSFDFW